MDEKEARAIAADWHGGQTSALYSFASAGYFADGLLSEIDANLREGGNVLGGPDDDKALEDLQRLEAYVREHAPIYLVGSNMVGCLPEGQPWPYYDHEDAKRDLIDSLERDAEVMDSWNDEHDCDDVPCPTYGDQCKATLAEELSYAAEDLNLTSHGKGWDAIVGTRAYWLKVLDPGTPEHEEWSAELK